MAPDARWLLATALVVSAVIWTMFCWHRPADRVHPHLPWSLPETEDPPHLSSDAAADTETRWIGHDPVVRHHPDAGRSHFFAELDAQGRWERDAARQGPPP